MRARRLAVAAVLVGLMACSDSSGPSRIEVASAWAGPVATNSGTGSLALTLTESGGTVNGTGTLVAGGASVAISATGTYAPPTVSLTLTADGFTPMNLTATVGETSMAGTLNGSGFLNAAVTLTRQ